MFDNAPIMFTRSSSACSVFFANLFINSSTFNTAASSILPNVATPASSSSALPDNNASLTTFKKLVLSAAVCLLNTVRIGGNIASIFTSSSLDIVLATLASAALAPIDPLSMSKNSCVLPLRALNLDATLSIHLSNWELATSSFLFLSVNFFITVPAPLIAPVNNAPSVPNLTLFNISLTALSSSSLLILVGPPNKSPNVPISSTSPTNVASAAPAPKAPATACLVLPAPVSVVPLPRSSNNFGSLSFTYLPFCLANIADFANPLALFKAIPPGIPMLTNSSVIFPAVVASAFSSNSVRSSNHCSTAAALPVLAPRSIKLAPKEKKPLGIAITPDTMPDSIDSIVPTLLFLSALFKAERSTLNSEDIYYPAIICETAWSLISKITSPAV